MNERTICTSWACMCVFVFNMRRVCSVAADVAQNFFFFLLSLFPFPVLLFLPFFSCRSLIRDLFGVLAMVLLSSSIGLLKVRSLCIRSTFAAMHTQELSKWNILRRVVVVLFIFISPWIIIWCERVFVCDVAFFHRFSFRSYCSFSTVSECL